MSRETPQQQVLVEQLAANFYTMNLSIVVAGCLGLLATRVYDFRDTPWPTQVWMAIVATIVILVGTNFGYYFFLVTVRRTNHVIDVCSPLLLGVIEGASISCIRDSGVSPGWWDCQMAYALVAALLVAHTQLYVSADHVHPAGRRILRTVHVSKMISFCVAAGAMFAGRYLAVRGMYQWSNMVLLGAIAGCLLSFPQDNWYLRKWQKATLEWSDGDGAAKVEGPVAPPAFGSKSPAARAGQR